MVLGSKGFPRVLNTKSPSDTGLPSNRLSASLSSRYSLSNRVAEGDNAIVCLPAAVLGGTNHYLSPHRFRDAFSVHAMKLDDSGDALRLLQEHLGHASFNTTARYRKVAGEKHRK